MFSSKYPIISLGMNQVSNLSLALAVDQAGAIPTITAFNYLEKNNFLNLELLTNDFDSYHSQRNNCNFIFSIDDIILYNYKNKLLEIFIKYNIKYLEILLNVEFLLKNYNAIEIIIKTLKSYKIKLITKLVSIENLDQSWFDYINNTFDGVVIKGPDSAGRVSDNTKLDLKDLLIKCIELFPNKLIIPCGGVGTSNDVKELLDLGAGAVGIGTLFAASLESPLSMTAKEKIIKADVTQLKKIKTYDFNQNALVFSFVEQSIHNNTEGLIQGINTGTTGHVFLGKGVNYITEIKSVEEIILDLTNF